MPFNHRSANPSSRPVGARASARENASRSGPGKVKEQRKATPMKIKLLALCAVIALAGSEAALAQAEVQPLANVIGMPFSGVRTNQGAKNFADGNRIDRGGSEHLYRDGQG